MHLIEWQRQFSRALKSQDPQEFLLKIYRDAYWFRMSEALSSDFPLLSRYLGSHAFTALVTDFLQQPRSFQPDLAEVSGSFAEYVKSRFPVKPASRAALLENAERECALAAGLSSVKRADSLALHPTAQLLEWGDRHYVIWRSEEGIERFLVDGENFQLLGCFAGVSGLEEALERMSVFSFASEFVQTEIAAWVAIGLLCYGS